MDMMANDAEINLVSVVFVGSPQINDERSYVSGRVGAIVKALGVEGANVTTEGFGNNHIDFTSHIEQIGKRGVVGNKYMNAMVDLNKDATGFEVEIFGDNTLCLCDAEKQDGRS